jgi:hypothetical protein
LNVVVVATESFLQQPRDIQSSICPVRERFVYLHSGAGTASAMAESRRLEQSFSWGRIVRTTFDTSNLFGLSLSLYYPATYVALIDLTRFPEFADSWLDQALARIMDGSLNVVAAEVSNGDAEGAVLMTQALARRFLLYTDIKYSEIPVMAVLTRACRCRSRGRIGTIGKADFGSTTCLGAPNAQLCQPNRTAPEPSYAIIVPTFRRDYMSLLFQSIMFQTVLPTRVIILQNTMKRLFDFAQLTQASKVPVLHVWATNWNTFFYLTYMVMMFLPEPYSFKLDDDEVCDDQRSIEVYLRALEDNPNMFIGPAKFQAEQPYCGVRIVEFSKTKYCNHVAKIVLYQSQAGKVLHRFRPYAYIGGEDIAISVTNSMECGTRSLSCPFACK